MKGKLLGTALLCTSIIGTTGCANIEESNHGNQFIYKYTPLPIDIYNGEKVYKGPNGGLYIITKQGRKRYLPRNR